MAIKESGSEMSTLAGKVLVHIELGEYRDNEFVRIKAKHLKALAASVLSQDETKGQKRAPRKRKAT